MTDQDHANMPDTDQGPVLAFLGSEDRNDATKRVDTHASIVFLKPDRALKVKRAIRLPFLDYSTLGKRKRACEEELSVNRHYAPHIYRRTVPVTRSSDGFHIGGDGPVVEWAVEMARFDENRTFDHLARADGISPELAESMADIMDAAHRQAEISDSAAWLDSIPAIIDRNSDKFRAQASLAPDQIKRLHDTSHERLSAVHDLLRDRAAAGRVRRCHGDAHLGNIVLIDDQPVLFDAIEFDPVIATTDILYDVAFPIMDLVHFGLDAAANRLLNRYLEKTWTENGNALRLLPLFLSMRAAIRSNVLFTRIEQSPVASVAKDAKSYFDLALRLLERVQPCLIAIGGKSGTGKSALARDVAALVGIPPGAIVLRSDIVRKQLCGVDPLVKLPAAAYAPDVTERVYDTLNDRARQTMAQGFSVIIDAAFLREAERDRLEGEAVKFGAGFRAIFLDADLDTRLSRVGSRERDASDAGRDIASQQEDYDLGRLSWPRVDASGSPRRTLDRSRAYLPATSIREDTE